MVEIEITITTKLVMTKLSKKVRTGYIIKSDINYLIDLTFNQRNFVFK